jgi:hypothetical protein
MFPATYEKPLSKRPQCRLEVVNLYLGKQYKKTIKINDINKWNAKEYLKLVEDKTFPLCGALSVPKIQTRVAQIHELLLSGKGSYADARQLSQCVKDKTCTIAGGYRKKRCTKKRRKRKTRKGSRF